jgi:hypothetical protein
VTAESGARNRTAATLRHTPWTLGSSGFNPKSASRQRPLAPLLLSRSIDCTAPRRPSYAVDRNGRRLEP